MFCPAVKQILFKIDTYFLAVKYPTEHINNNNNNNNNNNKQQLKFYIELFSMLCSIALNNIEAVQSILPKQYISLTLTANIQKI